MPDVHCILCPLFYSTERLILALSRIVVSACLQGAPAVYAHNDSSHGSRFRSGADLYSLKHAIHCHLHHRPRPSFCRHFSRHRQGHRQPFATSITAAAVAAAFDAFVAIDAFSAVVAIVAASQDATVSHRQPATVPIRAAGATTA